MNLGRNVARELRQSLVNPRGLCEALGLLVGPKSFKRQAGSGVIVCCPAHGEKNPSCSVRLAADGTIAVKCFACDFTGDALTLIGQVRGLEFRETLCEAATLAGRWDLLDELERGARDQAPAPAPPRPVAPAEPERDYPNAAEVDALFAAALACSDDADVSRYLAARKLDAPRVTGAVALAGRMPAWARYQGRTWLETGHRLAIPVYDASGARRSVRVARVIDGDSPKRLPPAGHKAAGLVMANDIAIAMLRGAYAPPRVLFVEGEPDFLTATSGVFAEAVACIGVVSGSWTPALALAVPAGSVVSVWTHRDRAGDAYAEQIIGPLKRWRGCDVRRWSPKEAA